MIELTQDECTQIECGFGLMHSHNYHVNMRLWQKIIDEHKKLIKNTSPNDQTDNLIP